MKGFEDEMANGVVKWFNPAKGFGFIQPDDGGPDVFVHIAAVERSGLAGLDEGLIVSYELEQDRRSGKMSAGQIQVVGEAPAAQRRAPAPRSGGYDDRDSYGGGQPVAGGAGSGVVKWFNTTKGFGFIQPEGGGADVFVHISAVERAGLRGLNEGQVVSYELESDRRTGKQSAGNLRVVGEGPARPRAPRPPR